MNTSILPLADKLALVTGASGNIGSAVAKRLTAEGAVVVVHYSSNRSAAQVVVDEIQKNGGQAILLGADLSRPSGPAELYAQLIGTPTESMKVAWTSLLITRACCRWRPWLRQPMIPSINSSTST